MMLNGREGMALYGVDSKELGAEPKRFQKGDTVEITFVLTNPLAPGMYYLNCGVRLDTQGRTEFLSHRVDSPILGMTSGSESTVAVGLLEMHAELAVNPALDLAG